MKPRQFYFTIPSAFFLSNTHKLQASVNRQVCKFLSHVHYQLIHNEPLTQAIIDKTFFWFHFGSCSAISYQRNDDDIDDCNNW